MSKLWDDTLAHLELNLSPQHFSTWIKPLKLVKGCGLSGGSEPLCPGLGERELQ
jgi:hypothetical protein